MAKGADWGAYTPIALRDGRFQAVPALRAKALAFVADDPSKAKFSMAIISQRARPTFPPSILRTRRQPSADSIPAAACRLDHAYQD